MNLTSRLYTIIAFMLVSLSMGAQTFTLQGRVTDENMNPVELATVSVVKQGKVAFTSLQGYYSMQLQSEDSVVVKFTMIGYKTKTRVLRHPKGRQTLQVVLYQDENTLGEVNVTGQRIQTDQTEQLKTEDMKAMVSANGNAVEAMVQSQAGVSTHNELSSQYNVRGGSFDENSVYINDVEVMRPFLVGTGQQEGLSIINPYMVERIGFSSGGFAAKYGDKMSSALDITYRKLKPEGKKKNKVEGTLAASLLGVDTYLGLATKNFSWLNSLRYKNTRSLLGSLETEGEYRPNFLDYQTYLSWSPNKKWTLDIIGDVADNHYNFKPTDRETSFGTMENVMNFRVYFDGQERDRFTTYFGTAGLTRHFGDSTSLSFLGTAFHTNEKERYDIQGQYWLNQTETSENLGVGTYFQHARNYLEATVKSLKVVFKHRTRQHRVEGAITWKQEKVSERLQEYEMRDSAGYNVPHTGTDLRMIYTMMSKNQLRANRMEMYLQDSYHFTSLGEHTLFTLNYGLRFSHWNYTKESILSPRVSLAITPAYSHNTTFRIATGLYYQSPFFKELRDTTTIDGTTYATLNNKIKSQRSFHFILGYEYRFKSMDQPFRFTAEAYYKALGNLIPYSVNNVKVTYYGENLCNGRAFGLDLKLYGQFSPGTDSWLTFSLMDTKMKLHGKEIPLPTDQRYGINLFFTDMFPGTTRWKMMLRLAYADGLPFSTPHRELETNSFRAPAYKRVDIGMNYRLLNNEDHHKGKLFKNIWLGVDCLNLFGISNVNSYYWITDVTNQQYAVPNYLTGRQVNFKMQFEF